MSFISCERQSTHLLRGFVLGEHRARFHPIKFRRSEDWQPGDDRPHAVSKKCEIDGKAEQGESSFSGSTYLMYVEWLILGWGSKLRITLS